MYMRAQYLYRFGALCDIHAPFLRPVASSPCTNRTLFIIIVTNQVLLQGRRNEVIQMASSYRVVKLRALKSTPFREAINLEGSRIRLSSLSFNPGLTNLPSFDSHKTSNRVRNIKKWWSCRISFSPFYPSSSSGGRMGSNNMSVFTWSQTVKTMQSGPSRMQVLPTFAPYPNRSR